MPVRKDHPWMGTSKGTANKAFNPIELEGSGLAFRVPVTGSLSGRCPPECSRVGEH
jgi:hypothetical protein